MKVYLPDDWRFEEIPCQSTSADPFVIVCERSTKSLGVAHESIYQLIEHAFPKEFQLAIELKVNKVKDLQRRHVRAL